MSDNIKSIKFKFELDPQSFQQVQNAIKSLTAELQKLGGVMGTGGGAFPGLSIGGAAPNKSTQVAQGQSKGGQVNQPTMGKVLVDNAQAFKKFANESKDASKLMTDALKRDISVQERALDTLKGKLSDLNDEFKLATKAQSDFLAAGNKQGAGAMSQHIANIEGRMAGTSGDIVSQFKTLQDSKGLLPSGGQGGILSFLNKLNNPMANPFSPASMGAMGAVAKIAGGIATAAIVGVQEHMAGTRMYLGQESSRGQFVNADIAAARAGDISNLQARRMILMDQDKRKDFRGQLGSGSKAETYIDAAGTTVGQVLSRVTGGLSDKLTGGTGGAIGTAFTDTSINQSLAQKQRDMIEQQKRTTEFQDLQYATQYFQQNIGARVLAARSSGMRLGRDKNGKFVDPVGKLDANLTEQGYDLNQFLGTRISLRTMGGNDFANRFAYNQMAAANVGYGGYAEAVKNLSMAAGGQYEFGNASMEFALGQGRIGNKLLGKKMDTNASIALANTLGGYDPGQGSIGTDSLIAAYQLGINIDPNASSLKQMMDTQAFKGGLDILGQFSTGSLDPYQRGKNVVMASQVLGKGADTYATDYLAGLNPKKLINAMMTGEVDETAKNLGLGQGDIAKYGVKMFGTMLDNYVGTSGPAGEAASRFKKSGQTLPDYLLNASDEEVRALSTALNVGSFGGQQQDTALAALRTMKGMATTSIGNVDHGPLDIGDLDPETKALWKNKADFMRKDSQRLIEEAESGRLASDESNLKREADAEGNFGKNLSEAADTFSKALNKLAMQIDTITAQGYRAEAPGKKK